MESKRKSCAEVLPGTPSLRRRTIISSTPLEPAVDYVNDDNIERQQLREKKKSETLKTQTKQPNEISGENLAIVFDKLSSIIQMSNAKKINPSNVWKIQASDYLKQIVTGNCKDFQFLATALSATVHIYDMKVTDLHNIVLKFANNLLQEAAETETNEDNEQGDEKAAKKKPTRRFKFTADPESLRGKPELYDKPSQLLYKAKHHAENFMSSKNNFQAFLDMDPENLDYILDSEANYWESISKVPEPVSKEVNWIQVKNAPKVEDIKKAVFCPEFEDFSFLNWNSEDDSRALEDFHLSMKESAMNYMFDMDVEAKPIDDSIGDNEMHHDDIEISEDVIKEAPVYNNAVEYLVDMRPSHNERSTKFLEYSFRPLPGAWAGPSYWKLKGNINRVLTKSTTDCPIERLKKKKEPKPIDFHDISSYTSTDAVANSKSKLTTAIIKKNTMLHWNRDAVTFPRNYHIKVSDLLPLQMNKRLMVRSDNNRSVSRQSDDTAPSYDYNNLNDSQYVANMDNDNEDNVGCQDDFPQEEECNNDDGPLELIDAPFSVPKLAIDYARKAKFVDMRKVQEKAHTILTSFAKDDKSEIKFSNVFGTLKKQMPGADLSYGIVFSAVLHLCNSHGFTLTQQENLKDITVSNVPSA